MQDDFEESEEFRNIWREVAQKGLSVIYPCVVHATTAVSRKVGLAQVRFALDLEDRSMRDVAADLNVTVACISKGAKELVESLNLPTPRCMKSEEASESYGESRIKQLTP